MQAASSLAMVEKDEAMFRSSEMSLVQFYIPQEMGRDAVYTLGQLGIVQFRDLNAKVRTFQRTFVDDIKKLDNVERQYRYFYKLLQKHNIKLFEADDERFSASNTEIVIPPSSSVIDDHVQNALYLEQRLLQMEEASEQLQQQKSDLEQYRYMLQSGDQFFSGGVYGLANISEPPATTVDDDERAIDSNTESSPLVNCVSGVISREKIGLLEQILWRVLRGNLFFKHIELPEAIYDRKTKEMTHKNAFIVFSPGQYIIQRIQKIAESLDADLYEIAASHEARSIELNKINHSLGDLYTVLQTTMTTLESELYAVSKELNAWLQDISREKEVFQILNKFSFDKNRKILLAEGWIPKDDFGDLQLRLNQITTRLGIDAPSMAEVIETTRTPPTFHRTNKFTGAFQNICDCYGIAKYREVNAGLPTIVTFPFMFAIMFGDMGHGLLMALAALVLVMNESKIEKMKRGEIFDMAYSGRYILLLMGLFSVYTGFLYNDIFSKSMNVFKSGWKWPDHWEEGETIVATQVGTYPIGLDWAWHGTENDLLFSNSYKMKLSILMGFIHMTYSYMFSLVNHLHFKSWIDIVGNFIPGLIFLESIFGYLSVCIVYKWSKDWIKDSKPAPGLLNMLINMFLSPGTIDDELYPHQAQVQIFLLCLALICVPWLLLAKPLHFKYVEQKKLTQHHALPTDESRAVQELLAAHRADNNNSEEIMEDDEEEKHHQEESFGDIMIHQVIHTIEFCLNCVSHTASYLRLWALSLAHAQLSSVLWTMTIEIAFGMAGSMLGVFMTVFLFAMWFVLTCAILVVMEGTSAMLHSLRLHWVESMSKYFVGDGIYYEPFLFKEKHMEELTASPAPGASMA